MIRNLPAGGAWITLEVALASPAAGPGARHAGALASSPLQVGARHRGGLHHRHSRHPGSGADDAVLLRWSGPHQRDLHLGQRGATTTTYSRATRTRSGSRCCRITSTSARLRSGCATIGFIFGAYMTETFRGAILAVDKGSSRRARLWHAGEPGVCADPLPQMIATSCPGLATTGWYC